MREKEIEAYLRDKIKVLGGIAYKFVSPGNVGVPDRLILLPGGAVVFAELKTAKGTLTKLQQQQISRIRIKGGDAWVLKGKDEVDEFIEYCKSLIADKRKEAVPDEVHST